MFSTSACVRATEARKGPQQVVARLLAAGRASRWSPQSVASCVVAATLGPAPMLASGASCEWHAGCTSSRAPGHPWALHGNASGVGHMSNRIFALAALFLALCTASFSASAGRSSPSRCRATTRCVLRRVDAAERGIFSTPCTGTAPPGCSRMTSAPTLQGESREVRAAVRWLLRVRCLEGLQGAGRGAHRRSGQRQALPELQRPGEEDVEPRRAGQHQEGRRQLAEAQYILMEAARSGAAGCTGGPARRDRQ